MSSTEMTSPPTPIRIAVRAWLSADSRRMSASALSALMNWLNCSRRLSMRRLPSPMTRMAFLLPARSWPCSTSGTM
jgi:hypothetical protein